LRPPLSNIVMNLRYLHENINSNLTDEAQQQVLDAYSEARSTWQLAENLFLWARCQKNEIVNNPEKCNLNSILKDTLLFHSLSIEHKKIIVSNEVNADLEVNSDRKIINLIIHNLISNALKYSNPKGEVQISAITGAGNVELSITDNGIGIADNILPYIMDVSRPITTMGTASEKGSGLGLTICNELSKIIGAQLKVESKKNAGTTVTLTIPQS